MQITDRQEDFMEGDTIGDVPIVAVLQFIRSKPHWKFCLLTDPI